MDGLKHPVGDQPANIYWRRRMFVIVAIVVFALFLWWAISSLSSDSPGASPTSSPESTVSTSPTVNADPGRPCTGDDYTVVAAVPAEVSASKKVSVTVTVASASDSACKLDPTTGSKLTVRSGNDAWFDSADCPAEFALFDSEAFILEPAKTRDLTTTWNYGRDAKGCLAELQTAKDGTYKATVTVAGVKADEATFAVS
jgi:predicted component of type VI protein secretion system